MSDSERTIKIEFIDARRYDPAKERGVSNLVVLFDRDFSAMIGLARSVSSYRVIQEGAKVIKEHAPLVVSAQMMIVTKDGDQTVFILVAKSTTGGVLPLTVRLVRLESGEVDMNSAECWFGG
jgi:hypothetical protein